MAENEYWLAQTYGTWAGITRSTEPMWRVSYHVPPDRTSFMNPRSLGVITDIGPYPEPEDPDMKLPEGF
mgnify:CR=1 FL=1